MTATMMGCGHTANATHHGTPICIICAGIHPNAATPATPPDLTGRTATCLECGTQTASSMALAFFEHCPALSTDRYYCGCKGWN